MDPTTPQNAETPASITTEQLFEWLKHTLTSMGAPLEPAVETALTVLAPLAPFGLTFALFKLIILVLCAQDVPGGPMRPRSAALYGAAAALPIALLSLDVIGLALMAADQLRLQVIEAKAPIGFIDFAAQRRQRLRRRLRPQRIAAAFGLAAACLLILAVTTEPLWRERPVLHGPPFAAPAAELVRAPPSPPIGARDSTPQPSGVSHAQF